MLAWVFVEEDSTLAAVVQRVSKCTARLSGGWDCQGTSPLTGRHPMRALLQLACGLPVDAPLTWKPAQGYAACAAILPQVSGTVHTLHSVKLNPNLLSGSTHSVIWAIQPDDAITPAQHNGARSGFVLAHASTYDGAWQRAHTAAEALAAGVEVR